MDWHYADNGQQIGPVSEERFLQLVESGSVKPDTPVWRAGMTEWKPLREARPDFPPPLRAGTPASFCSSCGRSFPATDLAMFGESAICMECKPAWMQRLRQGMISTASSSFRYAGFWIRFLAVVIDGVILGVVYLALFFLIFGGTIMGAFTQAAQNPDAAPTPAQVGTLVGGVWIVQLLSFTLQLAYYTFFWVRFGATVGQMAVGVKVVRADGSSVSVGQAIGRYFARILSSLILLIGFMMAGWDDQKRALHDRLANTRVIRVR